MMENVLVLEPPGAGIMENVMFLEPLGFCISRHFPFEAKIGLAPSCALLGPRTFTLATFWTLLDPGWAQEAPRWVHLGSSLAQVHPKIPQDGSNNHCLSYICLDVYVFRYFHFEPEIGLALFCALLSPRTFTLATFCFFFDPVRAQQGPRLVYLGSSWAQVHPNRPKNGSIFGPVRLKTDQKGSNTPVVRHAPPHAYLGVPLSMYLHANPTAPTPFH
jgi:hypothetical protein